MSQVDTSELQKYIQALAAEAPSVLREMKAGVLVGIGEYDIKTLRATGLSKIKLKSDKAKGAFRFKLEDENTLSQYSKWPAAKLLQDGGNAVSRGTSRSKMQIIFAPGNRDKNGKRKWTYAKITKEIAAGRMMFIKRTGRPTILIRRFGRLNKKGQPTKASRSEVIGFLYKTTRHKGGWFSLDKNSQQNEAQHEKIILDVMGKKLDQSKLVDK